MMLMMGMWLIILIFWMHCSCCFVNIRACLKHNQNPSYLQHIRLTKYFYELVKNTLRNVKSKHPTLDTCKLDYQLEGKSLFLPSPNHIHS